MSETMTSLLVVFSEVGALLALGVLIFTLIILRRNHKDRVLAKTFVETLRKGEVSRKENLMNVLQKVHTMEPELSAKTAHMMLTCEKAIYNRVLNMFLGHDRENLAQLQRDVENMANSYRKLIDSVQSVQSVDRGENPKQNAQLRLQIKQLENEKAKLEKDLAESMISMENMLKEYTQMYSGGGAKKEGVKHIENELTQLKRKISENLVEEVDESSLDDTPDLSPPTPDK